MWIEREESGGFYVRVHNWRGHCPHEEAVIRRAADWFRRPVPDETVGRLPDSVRAIYLTSIDNGLYFTVSPGKKDYIPTTDLAWKKFLNLFTVNEPAALRSPERTTVQADDAILGEIIESRKAVRSIEKRVQMLKAELAPAPEELLREEKHLGEILAVLHDALDAAEALLARTTGSMNRSRLPAYSEVGSALCYIRNELTDLTAAIRSWIFVREHGDSGRPKHRRERYDWLMARARARQETILRRITREKRKSDDTPTTRTG